MNHLDWAEMVGLVLGLTYVASEVGVPARFLDLTAVLLAIAVSLCAMYGQPHPDWNVAMLHGVYLVLQAEGVKTVAVRTSKNVRRGGRPSRARSQTITASAAPTPAPATAPAQ